MKIKYIAIFFLILLPITVPAKETLCEKVESEGEGHWPLSEKEFTKKRYKDAIALLNDLSEKGSVVADYITIENEMMFIKGYFLRLYAQHDNKVMLNEFCSFIKNEAYVRH